MRTSLYLLWLQLLIHADKAGQQSNQWYRRPGCWWQGGCRGRLWTLALGGVLHCWYNFWRKDICQLSQELVRQTCKNPIEAEVLYLIIWDNSVPFYFLRWLRQPPFFISLKVSIICIAIHTKIHHNFGALGLFFCWVPQVDWQYLCSMLPNSSSWVAAINSCMCWPSGWEWQPETMGYNTIKEMDWDE